MKEHRHGPERAVWNEFTRTGKIGAYMLYRAIKQKQRDK